MGSFLSTLLDALVLKAHRDNVGVEACNAALLDFVIGEAARVATLRQALQTYDEAALERYILAVTGQQLVQSWLALCISTFSMTSAFPAPIVEDPC